MRRLRGRLGLWLLRPFLLAELGECYSRWNKGDQPMSYHKDWWAGGYFALARLQRHALHGQIGLGPVD